MQTVTYHNILSLQKEPVKSGSSMIEVFHSVPLLNDVWVPISYGRNHLQTSCLAPVYNLAVTARSGQEVHFQQKQSSVSASVVVEYSPEPEWTKSPIIQLRRQSSHDLTDRILR